MSSTNFSAKFKCAGCGEDIYAKDTLRIECVVCPNLDLCLDCFSSQVELGSHKSDHDYRFLDNGDFPPLPNGWTAREHLQLLEGLEQFGYGNWNDIADSVGTKGPAECRDLVISLNVDGPIGHHTWNKKLRGAATDHTNRNPLLPPPQTPSTPSDLSYNEAVILGFMPRRDDYEVEFENDAENLVSSIPMGSSAKGEEDEEVETALKLCHIDMYKAKMRERERRKQVARDHGLVTQFFKASSSKIERVMVITAASSAAAACDQPTCRAVRFAPANKKKDPKTDITERLKIVAEFQGTKEHKDFMTSMIKERDLKSRIKELSRYRKNGFNKLAEAEDYESQRMKRNKKKQDRKKVLEAGGQEASTRAEGGSLESSVQKAALDLDRVTSIVGQPGYCYYQATLHFPAPRPQLLHLLQNVFAQGSSPEEERTDSEASPPSGSGQES